MFYKHAYPKNTIITIIVINKDIDANTIPVMFKSELFLLSELSSNVSNFKLFS